MLWLIQKELRFGVILPVAIKYGGGGHSLACGATVNDFEIVKEILKDMEELAKEN